MMTFIILAVALTTVVLILNEYGWTDLTGGTRNNLVFEARNKSYGAYEIRQNYSTRLFVAVIGAMSFISIAAVSPKFFMGSKPIAQVPTGHVVDTITMTNPDKPKEEQPKEEIKENKVAEPSAPAAPKNTLIPPVVTDKPVVIDTTPTNKPIVTDGSANGDSTLANNSNTPPGPIGGNGTGGGEKPCIDCPPPVRGIAEVDQIAELKDYQRILMKTIHIPQRYLEMGGKGGRLYVSFIVDENGNISSATIKKGLDSELDNEVKRAINAMPRWKPAVSQGKNVPVKMIIPVNIQIQ